MFYVRDIHWLMVVAILVLTTMITYLPQTSEAIYCWQCNSVTDKFCEDVPSGPMENPEKLHDCYKKMYRECVADNDKLNYTFCRKQVQTIDKETRVIRACGFIRAPQDCYWTKTPHATTLVCQCDGDGCNHGSLLVVSKMMSLILPFSLIAARLLISN